MGSREAGEREACTGSGKKPAWRAACGWIWGLGALLSFPTQALAHPSQGDAGRPTAGGAVRMRDAGSEAEGGHLRTISKYAMTNPNSSTIKYSIFADLFLIVP